MAKETEVVKLTRACPVVLIPYGTAMTLPAGTTVYITQQLGGDFTVTTNMGYMARVDGKDADALGKPVSAPAAELAPVTPGEKLGKEEIEKRVWAQMKNCFDPEIPVNIVDLGLIYLCEVTPASEGEGYEVLIRLTLTAPGCGMGPVLGSDVERRAKAIPGVAKVKVDVVFDPPWSQSMMSEAAKLQLGLL